jgi:hypothetical protein
VVAVSVPVHVAVWRNQMSLTSVVPFPSLQAVGAAGVLVVAPMFDHAVVPVPITVAPAQSSFAGGGVTSTLMSSMYQSSPLSLHVDAEAHPELVVLGVGGQDVRPLREVRSRRRRRRRSSLRVIQSSLEFQVLDEELLAGVDAAALSPVVER